MPEPQTCQENTVPKTNSFESTLLLFVRNTARHVAMCGILGKN